MSYPNLYRQTEEKYGKPMSKLLPERFDAHQGRVKDVAGELGINPATLWRWTRKAGCKVRRVVERSNEPDAKACPAKP